jgi:hypothetical protein
MRCRVRVMTGQEKEEDERGVTRCVAVAEIEISMNVNA